jgi:hypothetical protein
MLEKLRDNPRAVVAALVAAGVLAVAVGASNRNQNNSGDTPSTPASEVSQEDSSAAEQQPQDQPESEAEANSPATPPPTQQAVPPAGPVSVTSDQGTLKATVRRGDSQTVIVRQMVTDYLGGRNETLSAEQKLFVETTLVSKLPKSDKIFTGQMVSLSETTVADTVAASKNLSQAAIARWNKYL